MTSRRAELKERVERAFGRVPGLPADQILAEGNRGDYEFDQLAEAFGGRNWRELSVDELFYYRDSLNAVGAPGYLSYAPAYLHACLRSDDELVYDIVFALVQSLRPQRKRRTTRQRLELFDEEQRAVVHAVLAYLGEVFEDEDVELILAKWDE